MWKRKQDLKAEGSSWGNFSVCWAEIECKEASLRIFWAISTRSPIEIEGKRENWKDLKAISVLCWLRLESLIGDLKPIPVGITKS